MNFNDILGSDPDLHDLLSTENNEEYKGWLIYDDQGKTQASKMIDGGIMHLEVAGTTNTHRTAIKMNIDEREV